MYMHLVVSVAHRRRVSFPVQSLERFSAVVAFSYLQKFGQSSSRLKSVLLVRMGFDVVLFKPVLDGEFFGRRFVEYPTPRRYARPRKFERGAIWVRHVLLPSEP